MQPLNGPGQNLYTQITRASNGAPPAPPTGNTPFQPDGVAGSVPQPPVMMQPAATQQPQVRTLPSGVQICKDQGGVAFQAVLPAGPLLPCAVLVQSAQDGAVSAQANIEGQAVPLNAARGNDGRVYVQADPSNPNLIYFEPQTENYGVNTGFDPAGNCQKAQTITPDGTSISSFNEVNDGHSKTSTRVYENARGVWGAKVTESLAAPQQGQGGLLQQAQSFIGAGGRKPVQEDPVAVSGSAAQGYTVKGGGSLLDYGKQSTKAGFDGIFDWKQAPVQRWLRGRKQEELHLMPLSAAGPGALFPSLLQGVRP